MTVNAILTKEKFKQELIDCLTIIDTLDSSENYDYYKCEYVTPALYKKNVIIAVIK